MNKTRFPTKPTENLLVASVILKLDFNLQSITRFCEMYFLLRSNCFSRRFSYNRKVYPEYTRKHSESELGSELIF